MTNLYAHRLQAANYQQFVDASIADWWEFSHQFTYAKAWADTSAFTPAEAKEWAKAVEGQVNLAVEFKTCGFTPETATPWFRNTTYSPVHCAKMAREGRAPRVIRSRPQRTR